MSARLTVMTEEAVSASERRMLLPVISTRWTGWAAGGAVPARARRRRQRQQRQADRAAAREQAADRCARGMFQLIGEIQTPVASKI
jgi:hypothetical protein